MVLVTGRLLRSGATLAVLEHLSPGHPVEDPEPERDEPSLRSTRTANTCVTSRRTTSPRAR